jgi:hypothetical protein
MLLVGQKETSRASLPLATPVSLPQPGHVHIQNLLVRLQLPSCHVSGIRVDLLDALQS